MTPNTKCSIAKVTSLQTNRINDLKIQLAKVSNKLIIKLNKIEEQNNTMNNEMDTGGIQIKKDIKQYKENAQKILSYITQMPNSTSTSSTLEGYENAYINNVVSDSIINSNQGIYSYIIWSIIAIIVLMITIYLLIKK